MSTFPLLEHYAVLKRELGLIFAGETKNSNLGRQQVQILYRLLESSCSMSELSFFTQADPAATTRTVAGLEKAGFVKRVSDAGDARKSIIQLTTKGKSQADEALKIRANMGRTLETTLSKAEHDELCRLLGKVNSELQLKRQK